MTIIKTLLIAIITIFDTCRALYAMKMGGGEKFYNLSRKWARLLLKISGVKVVLEGAENLEHGKAYIIASNHSSIYDIPVMLAYFPLNINILYKEELEKFPIWGFGLKKSPFVAINRSRPRKAAASLQIAADKVTAGVSLFIFPEGTRTKDGTLGEFKRGALSVAGKTGADILPVAISGTFGILPKNKMKIVPSLVTIKILKPVETPENMTKQAEIELLSKLREKIENNLVKVRIT